MRTTAALLLLVGLCLGSSEARGSTATTDDPSAPPPIAVDQAEILEP
jgi:hypothetical protein